MGLSVILVLALEHLVFYLNHGGGRGADTLVAWLNTSTVKPKHEQLMTK